MYSLYMNLTHFSKHSENKKINNKFLPKNSSKIRRKSVKSLHNVYFKKWEFNMNTLLSLF